MKDAVKKILSGIDQEIADLLPVKKDGRKRVISTDDSLEKGRRMQQLRNAHIMICNAFDEQSEYERGIRFQGNRKKA